MNKPMKRSAESSLQSVLVGGLAVAALIGSGAAYAGPVTGSFGVSANVTVNCKVTGTTLAFGAYDPTSPTALDGSSTLTITCTKGAVVSSVQLDRGANSGSGGGSAVGPSTQRNMASGGDSLAYNLFTDAPRTLAWASTTTGNGFTSAGPSSPNILTVYGRIPIGQNVPVGSYTDTVTATVNF